MKKSKYEAVRTPNGTYEVRCTADGFVAATTKTERRAKMLAYTYGQGQ